MFKVTIKCKNAKVKNIVEILDRKFSRFKVSFYENATYASFKLKSLNDLMELCRRLTDIKGVQFNCKVEKVKRFWKI